MMPIDILPYVRVLFFTTYGKDIELPSGFVRREELVTALAGLIQAALLPYEAQGIVDSHEIAGSFFEELSQSPHLEIIEDQVAGNYYRFIEDEFDAYVDSELKGSPIFHNYGRIGDSYFNDVFELYQDSGFGIDIDLLNRINSVDQERIVTIGHNSGLVDSVVSGVESIVHEISKSNEAGEALGDERDVIIDELKAGEQVISAKRFRVGTILALLVKPLKYLADKFASGALGEAATQLIWLIIKVFS